MPPSSAPHQKRDPLEAATDSATEAIESGWFLAYSSS